MNVLAVGSHFNNIEIGCGGALLRHRQKGDKITLFVAATSGILNSERQEVRKDDIVFQDAQEAAGILGGKLICGGFETLRLEFEDNLNAKLVHMIEKQKFDLIYTHFPGDIQHDHRALARAAIHAGRHVPRMLGYRCTWYQSETPFVPNFFVDISDMWEKKEALMRLYRSDSGRVKEGKIAYFKNDAENNGRQNGVSYAEGFQVIKWLER
ncbi:PIG-L deacetylase family protein [Lachnospiraceae bacterium JLR.KK008]